MRRFWTYIGFVLCLMLWTGCKTSHTTHPKAAEKITPLYPQTAEVIPAPQKQTPPEPQPLPEKPVHPLVTWLHQQKTNSWIPVLSLNWQTANGPAIQHQSRQALQHRITTAAGTLELAVGNRVARWNGVCFWLGFTPQYSNGQFVIHYLDYEKNIIPLLIPIQKNQTPKTVLIDPGHGGKSVGASNIVNGHFEKEYTLDLAIRSADILIRQGWRVFLTRTNDTDIPLAERVTMADTVKADLFISLHFNSGYPNTEHSGIETYCLTPVGMQSSLTREYADDPTVAFPNNTYDLENFQWAVRIHGSVQKATQFIDQGIRRARFMGVLRGHKRPAVLLEGGFLSNPKEAALIADTAFRQKMAEALAEALK